MEGFNAARGFVSGAAAHLRTLERREGLFQCRTRLCGWCSDSGRARLPPSHLSMPHAAFWVVQPPARNPSWEPEVGFNAARGFVGGAATQVIAVFVFPYQGFNAARGFVGGAASSTLQQSRESSRFQCRTRLCGWCSGKWYRQDVEAISFQCRTRLCGWCSITTMIRIYTMLLFQCRTRLCGWCSNVLLQDSKCAKKFQCRTRLCGWCSLVALSSCPPKRKKAFWKVSGNLRCLTENI